MTRLADRASGVLGARTSRRGFLTKTAMVATALTVSPFRYILQPVTAYAAVCGCAGQDCDCGSACCDGFSAFCCEVNNGVNACPSGTFPGGWWRADGSIFCGGTRYIVDCNAECGSDFGCGCAQGDCGRRVSGCNHFRYGQCNQHLECAGAIVCRVASCVPPYQLDLGCSDETFWDNSTANHSADCSVSGAGAAAQPAADPVTPVQDPDADRAAPERADPVEEQSGDVQPESEGRREDSDADREESRRQRDAERAEQRGQREAERQQRAADRAAKAED